MYYSIEELVNIHMRYKFTQRHLIACYRDLVDDIKRGQMSYPDIVVVRNMLYLDVHSLELCRLKHKLGRALERLGFDIEDMNDDLPLS